VSLLKYLDDDLLVLEKPAGLLTVPGRGPDKLDCLALRALEWAPDALVVHRLDMATSGLVVMARNKSVQRALGDAFANRQVQKQYEALVHGQAPDLWRHDWTEINAPLVADWPNRPLQKVDWVTGKPSQTWVRSIAHNAGSLVKNPIQADLFSRVQLRPLTGRSHQLRVHLLYQGYPIVGDTLYDPQRVAVRLYLHASHLQFVHPVTGQSLAFKSPVPF
jgi:tRNA pseudouridine32 synthase/23S rRNA pseudouridine746 synthase